MRPPNRLRAAARASLLHLGLSAAVAAAAAALVFGLWYPFPFRELSGGRELFWLIMSVDVVCGPLLTAVLFTPSKPRGELVRDLSLVAAIQLAALVYGLYVVTQSRPVFMAFEVDRFQVVSANEVHIDELQFAPSDLRSLSLTGPRLIAVHVPKPGDADYLSSLELALAGRDAFSRPALWRDYESYRSTISKKARPIAVLKEKQPRSWTEVEAAIAKSGLDRQQLGYLPIQSRKSTGWVALVDTNTAAVVGYVETDGF